MDYQKLMLMYALGMVTVLVMPVYGVIIQSWIAGIIASGFAFGLILVEYIDNRHW